MIGLVILGIGGSCWQRQGDSRDLATRYAEEGDRFFMQRADPDKLDSAISTWQEGLLASPDSPILLGRLSEGYTVRALSRAEHRPDGYVVARELGVQCLKGDPFVAGVVQTYGGRLVPRAIRTVKEDLVGCLTWTSIAWSRWLQLHGAAGAALDLDIVTAMAQKAVELDADHDRGRPLHALGLALSLPPEPLQPDLAAAEEALSAARAAAPERWWIEVDLAEQIYGPTERDAAFVELLGDIQSRSADQHPQESLENQAAILRAGELLQAGPRPGWAP